MDRCAAEVLLGPTSVEPDTPGYREASGAAEAAIDEAEVIGLIVPVGA